MPDLLLKFLILARSVCLFFLFVFAYLNLVSGQQITYKDRPDKVVIPFEFYNNFIVATLKIRGLPLKFIVDTGAEHTILLRKEISDILQIHYDRKVRIMGADLSTQLYAFISQNLEMELSQQLSVRTDLLILEEDFIELDKLVGVNIFGILGSNVLKNFVVEFNYRQLKMVLHPQEQFKPPGRKFESMAIDVHRGKPYMDSRMVAQDQKVIEARLLMDTGAALSVLYYISEKNNIEIPDKFVTGSLGIGLGGSLKGYMGKVKEVAFGPYTFHDLVANYQKLAPVDSVLISGSRDGIMGNIILCRFTLILDYKNRILYFKPNRLYKKKIRYDRSGLILINSGALLDEISVLNVIEGSPAEEAGILPGDQIIKMGIWPVNFLTFTKVNNKMTGKPGKRIKLKILRGDLKIDVVFRLRDII